MRKRRNLRNSTAEAPRGRPSAASLRTSSTTRKSHLDCRCAFPDLGKSAFRGLPGLLADSLPDTFGNQLIDVWLVDAGRRIEDFNRVDRLCYIGSRGMGALEFEPAIPQPGGNTKVNIAQLRELAELVMSSRKQLSGVLEGINDRAALENILAVGTSAGGARAKAVLAWNPQTGEFRSGQVDANQGFEPWILKFDGITDKNQQQLGDPQGFGRIEYAYHRMARDAGIEMSE
ncbi:MAG: HipA N-terminal domain-containing protein [Gammaproteobacteria bacterium]|nr:HipA N-terminal domain-containing protein [Gammaproteobacteria bacterium]